MYRVYHNYSFKPLIPPQFDTQNQDMCHGIIGFSLIEIQSKLDQHSSTLKVVDVVLIGNGCLYYSHCVWRPRWQTIGAKPSGRSEKLGMRFSFAQTHNIGRIGLICRIMNISVVDPWEVNSLH